MNLAERLSGAVIAGLMTAALLPQAEALAASPDIAVEIGQVRSFLADEAMTLVYPGERLLDELAHERSERSR